MPHKDAARSDRIAAFYKIKEKAYPYLFIMPFFVIFFAFNLFPIGFSFFLSLCEWSGIDKIEFVGMQNYRYIFNDDLFFTAFKNVFTILLTSTVLIILFALVIAFILNTGLAGSGKKYYQAFYFLPYITPGIAVGLLFSFMFDWQNGLVNWLLANLGLVGEPVYWTGIAAYAKPLLTVVLLWKYFGYVMVLIIAGIQTIPVSLNEAAKVDGANPVRIFCKITLPMLKNIMVFIVVTSVIGTFQLFDEPLTLFSDGMQLSFTGGPGQSAYTIMMYLYSNSFRSFKLGIGSASAICIFAAIIICSYATMKIVSGKGDGNA